MQAYTIPYGRQNMRIQLPKVRVDAVLAPLHTAEAETPDEIALVRAALAAPIDSPRLCDLSRSAQKILLITSDHTRPVPSHVTMPELLAEIRMGNPLAEIRILVATGCHRPSTQQELEDKFGVVIARKETFCMHISGDTSAMTDKGYLPSGGILRLNALIDWADLVVSEGFIEPHFFAGFSGGRKSILPGIAARETVLANHCAKFIADSHARAGILDGNPLHTDMLYAARQAGLRFILNVSIDAQKRVTGAWAGEMEAAHRAGCTVVGKKAEVTAVEGDIVITTNGGYPLDQNIYQAVKGMTAAESCVRPGGVIIMCASCCDGHGGESFYRMLHEAASPQALWEHILQVPQDQTLPDQWEAQVLARILCRAQVILVSDVCDPAIIQGMHMQHASTFQEAMCKAEMICPKGRIVLIPDGVSVVVRQKNTEQRKEL